MRKINKNIYTQKPVSLYNNHFYTSDWFLRWTFCSSQLKVVIYEINIFGNEKVTQLQYLISIMLYDKLTKIKNPNLRDFYSVVYI